MATLSDFAHLQAGKEAEGSFSLAGMEIDLPSADEQALKRWKAIDNLRQYISRCGGRLPQAWDCALKYRTTTRKNGRLGLTTDNFYYSPCGKTFRTHREVAEFLGLPEPPQHQQKKGNAVKPGKNQSNVDVRIVQPARLPSDPRVRTGLKRPAPDADAAVSAPAGECVQQYKRPTLAAPSCTSLQETPAEAVATTPAVLPSAVAATGTTTLALCSCEQQKQHQGETASTAVQPVRRTKAMLAAKYRGLSASSARSTVAINTIGSFSDLCFSLAAAANSPAQQVPLQQRHSEVQMPAEPAGVPADVQHKQQPVEAAVTAVQPPATQQRQEVVAVTSHAVSTPAVVVQPSQQQVVDISIPAVQSTVQDISVEQPAERQQLQLPCNQEQQNELQTAEAELVHASYRSAFTAVSPVQSGTGSNVSSRSGNVAGTEATAARATAAKQQCKHKRAARHPQLPQDQGQKLRKPRSQPAWREKLRKLASEIAASKLAASTSSSTA